MNSHLTSPVVANHDGVTDVKLYVKAGADGQRYGACPFCQRIFMILMLKSKHGQFRFTVATVNLSKPPEEFKHLGLRHVPALVHGDVAYSVVDDIIEYVDEVFPIGDLTFDDVHAESSCKNVFSKFCFFIKEVSKDPAHLLAELTKLNTYLQRTQHRFLCGDQLTHLDCELLPKLQHLRVATSYLKGFEIPANLTNVWRYLHNAYEEEAFVRTCPPDQEIVLHWADKPETPNLSLEKHAAITKEPPRFSFDVPAVARPITID